MSHKWDYKNEWSPYTGTLFAIHVNLDIIMVKVNSSCKWNNVDVNSIQKKKNYDVETLSLCVNIAKQILYINIPFSELSQRNCKICISQWTGRVGTQLLTSALCFLSRWLNYDHLWNKHNVCLASSTGSLRGSNVIQYVEVFCKL